MLGCWSILDGHLRYLFNFAVCSEAGRRRSMTISVKFAVAVIIVQWLIIMAQFAVILRQEKAIFRLHNEMDKLEKL